VIADRRVVEADPAQHFDRGFIEKQRGRERRCADEVARRDGERIGVTRTERIQRTGQPRHAACGNLRGAALPIRHADGLARGFEIAVKVVEREHGDLDRGSRRRRGRSDPPAQCGAGREQQRKPKRPRQLPMRRDLPVNVIDHSPSACTATGPGSIKSLRLD
jgi:hypothetical protein